MMEGGAQLRMHGYNQNSMLSHKQGTIKRWGAVKVFTCMISCFLFFPGGGGVFVCLFECLFFYAIKIYCTLSHIMCSANP